VRRSVAVLYDFGGFQLDDERFPPSGGEGRVHVEPQVADVTACRPTGIGW